jgi:hypothetical protein
MVVSCYPSSVGNLNKRIVAQAHQGINVRPYLKINQSKKDWGHGSSGRDPAQLLKPQTLKFIKPYGTKSKVLMNEIFK